MSNRLLSLLLSLCLVFGVLCTGVTAFADGEDVESALQEDMENAEKAEEPPSVVNENEDPQEAAGQVADEPSPVNNTAQDDETHPDETGETVADENNENEDPALDEADLNAITAPYAMVMGSPMLMANESAGSNMSVADFSGEKFTVSTGGDFPWSVINEDGKKLLAAGNVGNSSSELVISFSAKGKFTFNYCLESDTTTAHLCFTPQTISNQTQATGDNNISTSTSTGLVTREVSVASGDELHINLFRKSSGNVQAYVCDFVFEENSAVTVTAAVNDANGGTAAGSGSVAYGADATLTATPASGYAFVGWVQENASGKYEIVSTDTAFTFTANADVTYTAFFAPGGSGAIKFGAGRFGDLGSTLTLASGFADATVAVMSDYTLSESVIVPDGVTLLVACNESAVSMKAYPENVEGNIITPSAYCTLTVAEGASISVNGYMEVAGKHNSKGGITATGAVTGPYGHVVNNGSIVINDGAKLYVWGYITGQGTVNALSGSEVWEMFQICDWRGGNAVVSMLQNAQSGVFFFSQYYVQNIESLLIMQSGATEQVLAAMNASGFNAEIPFTFIGAGGMFELGSGSVLTKYYDASEDRLIIDVTGDGAINGLTLGFADARGVDALKAMAPDLANISLDSTSFVLPINSNMSIEAKSGEITIGQDIAMLPGSALTIDEDAEIVIEQDTELYIYTADSWVGNDFLASGNDYDPVPYTATTGGAPAARTLDDASVVVDGTLTVDGTVYSITTGDGDSEEHAVVNIGENGTINLNNTAGEAQTTNQVTQAGTETTTTSVNIRPMVLVDPNENEIDTAEIAVTPEAPVTVTETYIIENADGVAITVDNLTGGTANAVISANLAADNAKGGESFTVTCDRACAVAYTTDDGATYTALPAVGVDGEQIVYAFTLPTRSELENNFCLIIALKGDVTGDGIVDHNDPIAVHRSLLNPAADQYAALTVLGTLLADISGSEGQIDHQDAIDLHRSMLNAAADAYKAIDW